MRRRLRPTRTDPGRVRQYLQIAGGRGFFRGRRPRPACGLELNLRGGGFVGGWVGGGMGGTQTEATEASARVAQMEAQLQRLQVRRIGPPRAGSPALPHSHNRL